MGKLGMHHIDHLYCVSWQLYITGCKIHVSILHHTTITAIVFYQSLCNRSDPGQSVSLVHVYKYVEVHTLK